MMNYKFTFFIGLLLSLLFSNLINAQILFSDDFNYPAATNLSANGGWAVTGTAITTPIQVISNSLTYPGYTGGGGLGGAVQFGTSGEDDNHLLNDSVKTGSIYASFLLNCTASLPTGDYFIHFCDGGSMNYYARTFIKSDSGSYVMGIMKGLGGTTVWTSQHLYFSSTYLIIIKYTFNTATSTDDAVSLFVNPVLSSSEPTPAITTVTGNDFTGALKSINFRQGSAAQAPTLQLDGLRVFRQWSDIIQSGTITLTSPVGGENWYVPSVHNITWSSSNVNYIRIGISTDGGTAFATIADSVLASNRSYSWSILSGGPNLKIRISDCGNSSVQSISGAFNISLPSLTITSPVGGESWQVGSNHNITWTTSNINTAKIEYSTNSGASWTQICDSVWASSGIFTWTIPFTPAATCKIRISDKYNSSVNFVSANTFTIYQSSVTLTSPLGGESWQAGSTHNITWTSTTVSNVKLEYSTDNGSNWSTIIASIPASSGSYSWVIPYKPTSLGKVKISDITNSAINNVNTNVFTIISTSYVNLISPAAGNKLFIGSTYNITWTSSNVNYIRIERSTDDGNTFSLMADSILASSGSCSWNITTGASSFCKIRISDCSNSAINSTSGDFTIATPDLIITSPAGGEVWIAGSTHNITWTTLLGSNLAIEYVINGVAYVLNSSFPSSAGSYSWTIPNTPTNQCKIMIISYDSLAGYNSNIFTIASAQQTGWQSDIKVKDNGSNSQVLTFGKSPIATNGIDPLLGESPLPPAPPSGIFDARLALPVTPADYSLKDFRIDTLSSRNWVISFQPGSGGYPFTFTWNPSSLPAGSFYLKDMVTGNIVNLNMKNDSLYTLSNSGITSLKIEYNKMIYSNVNLSSGWNIISVPVIAADMTSGTLFPGATAPVYKYNNGYQYESNLVNGSGYWVRYGSSTVIGISGNKVNSTTIPVVAGWNIIGGYDNDIPVNAISTTPSGILNSPFYGFNNGYIQPSSLVTGYGYWIRSSQNGIINIPASLPKIKQSDFVTSSVDPSWGRIIIKDSKGNQGLLYTAKGTVNLNAFVLPPLPPAEIFDVRFGSDRNVELLSGGSQIKISSAVYPVTLRAEGTELNIKDNITGKLVDRNLKSGESIVIDNNAINTLLVSQPEVPVGYALNQNYPNPFNPSTTISFGIPSKGNVRISIYNNLGQMIEVLVDKEMEAGTYTQIWNAKNLSSGIYFYEMKSGEYKSVKKLLLMK